MPLKDRRWDEKVEEKTQLLHDLRKRRTYSELKEEAEDRKTTVYQSKKEINFLIID